MFKTLSVVAVLAVAAVMVHAATKPDTFSVQRSASIAAPAARVFALIDDPRAFNSWNPYAQKDPTIRVRYEGAARGPGAAYEWKSQHVGAGRMEVIESAAPDRVAMRLDFQKPIRTSNRVEFTLDPNGQATQITWAMTGPMPYVSKLMTTFIDMDEMVGGDFEAGLAKLKETAEST
jgi:uncharacterized protein YndB with AHSA1/START domain